MFIWCSSDQISVHKMYGDVHKMVFIWCSSVNIIWDLMSSGHRRSSGSLTLDRICFCVLCILKISAGSSFAWACITIRLAFSAFALHPIGDRFLSPALERLRKAIAIYLVLLLVPSILVRALVKHHHKHLNAWAHRRWTCSEPDSLAMLAIEDHQWRSALKAPIWSSPMRFTGDVQ